MISKSLFIKWHFRAGTHPCVHRATRLFVRMVTMQPWVEQLLRHRGGWGWEADRRAAAFHAVMQGYSGDREHIVAGLLQV
eukprot:scaffold70505_cov16-Prasinocladus_malaysianus.AAC.1